MKQLFQRQVICRAVTWYLRTLHSQSAKVTTRILIEDLGTGTAAQLNKAAHSTKSFPLFSTVPLLLQRPNLLILNTTNDGRVFPGGNPGYDIILPEIPKETIQELIFPHCSRIIRTIIGDHDTHELTVGDDTQDTKTLQCKRFKGILKIRRKKMKKHKYRKRRKRDLFKRRHLKVFREKRKAERKEEERKAKLEDAQ